MVAWLGNVADLLGVSVDQVREPYQRLRPQMEAAQLTNREFWAGLVSESGSALDPIATEHLWSDTYLKDSPIVPGILELIDELKRAGYKLGMFSNIDSEHEELNQPRHIFDRFDAALFSYQVKLLKPDPQAFITLAERLGVESTEMVFIDDLAPNIAGAREAGCYGIHFTGYNALIEELSKVGITV
jgi:HAD superfamily hydrolase (TIGR01509 family)